MSRTPSPPQLSKKGLPGREGHVAAPRPVLCQICGARPIAGLDLGHQPVGDLVLSPAQLNEPEVFYPMRLYHCLECGLTQLGYTIDPEVVYKFFPFVSGTTATATQHLHSLPHRLCELRDLDQNHFVVDIGSNDGTLLEAWRSIGVPFLGVDPAGDPVRIANERGLTTWHAFFNEETAEQIVEQHGQADAITACGCFAHIADLDGVMQGIVRLLAPQGVFASDNQYWLDMIERVHYDNIFHQHLRYYSLRPLVALFDRYGLEVFDVERSEVYGGSIRVYGGRRGTHPIHPRVGQLLATENAAALYDEATYDTFAREVDARRRKLFDGVDTLKKQGKKVIGIGAPAKASTVCTYCGLGPDRIDYITEVNPLRVGMYLPGVHIPIVDEAVMFDDSTPPDAGVLFSWNYHDEIMPKLRARGFDGDVLLP